MRRRIVSFHQDAEGLWIATLDCGHSQHIRHAPPFADSPWVLEPEGRAARIGSDLDCPYCDTREKD